ncbi:hypothetical protein VI817_003791 [Penicillium citrinum]|nr:hypothetical protein VI817_003791 [Penicillium citrinum]
MSEFDTKDQVTVQAASPENASQPSLPKDPSVAVVQNHSGEDGSIAPADELDSQKKGFLAFFKTKEFYIILALG